MPTAKSQPLRKCLGCNEMKDKRSLLRIVRDKDGNVFSIPPEKRRDEAHISAKASNASENAVRAEDSKKPSKRRSTMIYIISLKQSSPKER